MKLPTYEGLKAVNNGKGVFTSEPKTQQYQKAKAKVFKLPAPKKPSRKRYA